MNRIKDYVCFAACFAGLGYIVLWPVTADEAGASFGASIFCRDDGPAWLGFLCQSAQPLRLPPGLHALGFLSAVFVAIRAVVGAVKRSRRRSSPAIALQSADETPPPLRKLRLPLRTVKPRTHFGLRGVPR
jgi:hypothetical protein